MKKLIAYLFFIGIIVLTFVYRKEITNYITQNIIKQEPKDTLTYNEYYLNNNFAFVKLTNDFTIYNKDNLKDIFYTIINSGDDSFNFYCSEEYKDCIKDVKYFFSDQVIIANINNFIHPFNSFRNIKMSVSNYGKVTIDVIKLYSNEKIQYVNEWIDDFISNNINNSMSDNDKIKIFHDYIVNNTKFDTSVDNTINHNNSDSYNAYGLLTNNLAICGGYSDIMAIYLNKVGILNYRIATDKHIWNLVYLNGTWLHLDVTWDDPVTSNGTDMLIYDYYLIDTNNLLTKDITEHNFDKKIYIEAK